ncbi:MAG: DUF1501 domain-containing protein, partial [Bacteroidota bacterium]
MCHNHDIIRSDNKDLQEVEKQWDRRNFLTKTSLGLGALALGSLLKTEKAFGGIGANASATDYLSPAMRNRMGLPHHLPRAKRIVYLFQSGGPSQIDMFDYKPKLREMFGQDLPESVRQGQRLTAMSADQTVFPIAPSIMDFKQYGESRAWVSELMPYTSEIVDELCFIKSMQTDAINHDPAIT